LIGSDGSGHSRRAQIVVRISHGYPLQRATPGADDSYVALCREDVQDSVAWVSNHVLVGEMAVSCSDTQKLSTMARWIIPPTPEDTTWLLK
jgi:hypothetical protein